MKNFHLLSLTFFALALLPLTLFSRCATSQLKNHIQQTVVNDPQSGLSQNLNVLKNAVIQRADKTNSDALRFSENDNFKKFLSAPTPSLAAFKVFGKKLSDSTLLPLIIVADKKGNALYDNLNIPKPTPAATPVKKALKIKSSAPLLASLKDFPGMNLALAGTPASGFFYFQGLFYNGSLIPVLEKGKTLGVIILGTTVNNDFVRFLKSNTGIDLTINSQGQTWSSYSADIDAGRSEKIIKALTTEGRIIAPAPKPSNHTASLSGGFPLIGLDANPIAYLETSQTIKETLTVEGNPLKTLASQVWWFLLIAFLFAAAASWYFNLPFDRFRAAVDGIKNGNLNVDLPLNHPDGWGILARSLQEMTTSLKEKERVSLILGKVVSPQLAKNILEAGDLFALKGERREVTILHADLRGFNTLSENMPPPNLVEALNQYFTLINEIVFNHEGMLDKFLGETAIALWGAPLLHEDKEIRAVQTALEIQEALKDFNITRIKKGHPPFTIGIGIHTGLVVSGNLGSDKRYDYTVIGEPLHIAERLCAMAAPGQTVVSEETYQKVSLQVKGKALNPIVVKGSMEPLPTYEITKLI